MKDCIRCNSGKVVKSGKVLGNQRYKCNNCNYHFTENSKGYDANIKRSAIHLYLEGLSIRNIGRILNVSDVTVGKWIRPISNELSVYRKKDIKLKELHKIEHFMISKDLFNNYGWLLIGLEDNIDTCLLGSSETRNCKISIK